MFLFMVLLCQLFCLDDSMVNVFVYGVAMPVDVFANRRTRLLDIFPS